MLFIFSNLAEQTLNLLESSSMLIGTLVYTAISISIKVVHEQTSKAETESNTSAKGCWESLWNNNNTLIEIAVYKIQ
jgi:hypothetical protein